MAVKGHGQKVNFSMVEKGRGKKKVSFSMAEKESIQKGSISFPGKDWIDWTDI
jgi:hypothetical protein